jgi:hypothetical protein
VPPQTPVHVQHFFALRLSKFKAHPSDVVNPVVPGLDAISQHRLSASTLGACCRSPL